MLGPGELSEWRQRNCWIKRLEGTWEDANIMGDLKTDVQTLLGTRGRKLSGENSGDLKTGAQSLLGPGELMSCLARYRQTSGKLVSAVRKERFKGTVSRDITRIFLGV